MNIDDFKNFKKQYEHLALNTLYKVELNQITKKVKDKQQYDHLGPLPITYSESIIKEWYSTKKIQINIHNLYDLFKSLEEGVLFDNIEDAEFKACLLNLKLKEKPFGTQYSLKDYMEV